MKKDCRLSFRLDKNRKKKLYTYMQKEKASSSEAIRNIIDFFFLYTSQEIRTDSLQKIDSFLPDLKKQHDTLYSLKEKTEEFFSLCEEAFENINDMKKGEGFYFKNIFEGLKQQKNQFTKLVNVLSEDKAIEDSSDSNVISDYDDYISKIKKNNDPKND